jgi:hypothetical protein
MERYAALDEEFYGIKLPLDNGGVRLLLAPRPMGSEGDVHVAVFKTREEAQFIIDTYIPPEDRPLAVIIDRDEMIKTLEGKGGTIINPPTSREKMH